jgi:hypothetical protein
MFAPPKTFCGWHGCTNEANVTRCAKRPPRCTRCCDCGQHRAPRGRGEESLVRRGIRNPDKELVRKALSEHFTFLGHIEKVIDQRWSDWAWYRYREGITEASTFWEKHGLYSRMQRLEFCLSMAAQSGVSAADIAMPARQNEALTFVCDMSEQHFALKKRLGSVPSAKQLLFKHEDPLPEPLAIPALQSQVEQMFGENESSPTALQESITDGTYFINSEDIHAARQAMAQPLEPSAGSGDATSSGTASASSSKRPRPAISHTPLEIFEFEQNTELTQFPNWAPMADNLANTYSEFCQGIDEKAMQKFRDALPCEKLRHLRPTDCGWWCFTGTPLAPRSAYTQLQTITLKCGDVNKSLWQAWLARAPFGGVDPPSPHIAVADLCTFLNERPRCMGLIKKMRVASPRDLPANDVLKQMASGEKGFWIICDLADEPFVYQRDNKVYNMVDGWHASSMYSVWRMLRKGPDFAFETKGHKNKKVVAGFYYHILEQANLCSGYATYVPLSNSGFYYAPYWKLRTAKDDPDGLGTNAGGSNQKVCQPSCTELSQLLVHVVHMREMFQGEKANQYSVTPGWVPSYEMDSHTTLKEFVKRCEENQNQPVQIVYFRPPV